MPIYEYRCSRCGYTISDLEPVGSPALERECPIRKMAVDLAPSDPEKFTDCRGKMYRIPSIPAPARFNCDMPTYQKPKEGV